MKDKRTATVMIKLTAEEKKVLLLLADKKGQSLSGYIRQLVYEKNEEK